MNKQFIRFLILWFGGFVAAIGNGLTSFGLGVYVFEQTGLASATTFIMLLAFLPALLLSPIAGVLADRYDRRLMMILGDGISALGLIYIFIAMLNGGAALWQIGIGVTVSSVFSSLVEPAFRASISDLLTEDEYTKASGLVQISNSAKFLISPMLAGYLLIVSNIKLLLIIDICTIFITVLTSLIVRRGLGSKEVSINKSLFKELKEGFSILIENQGVFNLVLVSAGISFFIGGIQSLYTPMILSFTDSYALGKSTTISAMGMLVSSIFLGFVPIKKNFVRILSISLFLAGIFMSGFGLRENVILICIFGFMFFLMLPFANACLDYLVRSNMGNEVQGRVWGLIGIISQVGFIFAYGILGPVADYIFIPMFKYEGALANSIGKVIGIGEGRGIGFLIILSGILLSAISMVLPRIKSIKELEIEDGHVQ